MPMKKSSLFAAFVAAATATATAFSASSLSSSCNSNVKEAGSNKDQQRSASMDKFAPRQASLGYAWMSDGWQCFVALQVQDVVLWKSQREIPIYEQFSFKYGTKYFVLIDLAKLGY
ncbi:uncharacterized protein [Populus alba]|uniref:Uncharacterized protein n=1 Tax=Populus alba TaxID=43335 RepID=A0A4V6A9G3_POPAL|nr:uncharacterized protein LOC118056650 [Populus alba]TKS07096.1 hypothetical protein D5086_0000118050 [Populus alba]